MVAEVKRSPLPKRSAPLKRSPIRKKQPKSFPADVLAEIMQRDRGCVAQPAWREVQCAGRLDPHHALMRSQGGKDRPEDVIMLCRAHHDAVHQNPARSYALGLLRRGGNISEISLP